MAYPRSYWLLNRPVGETTATGEGDRGELGEDEGSSWDDLTDESVAAYRGLRLEASKDGVFDNLKDEPVPFVLEGVVDEIASQHAKGGHGGISEGWDGTGHKVKQQVQVRLQKGRSFRLRRARRTGRHSSRPRGRFPGATARETKVRQFCCTRLRRRLGRGGQGYS